MDGAKTFDEYGRGTSVMGTNSPEAEQLEERTVN